MIVSSFDPDCLTALRLHPRHWQTLLTGFLERRFPRMKRFLKREKRE
jgi:hypothetical protein